MKERLAVKELPLQVLQEALDPSKPLGLELGQLVKTRIYLISGSISSGKTTLANLVLEHFVHSKQSYILTYILHFAELVKNLADQFGWDGKKDDRGRYLLQCIGRVGREYDEDIFVRFLYNKLSSFLFQPEVVLIDDWRFENEYYFLQSTEAYEIIKVRITRPEEKVNMDISENSLPKYKEYYDYFIVNDGTKEELLEKFLSLEKRRGHDTINNDQ